MTGGELNGDQRGREPSCPRNQQAPLKDQRRLQALQWTALRGSVSPRQGLKLVLIFREG